MMKALCHWAIRLEGVGEDPEVTADISRADRRMTGNGIGLISKKVRSPPKPGNSEQRAIGAFGSGPCRLATNRPDLPFQPHPDEVVAIQKPGQEAPNEKPPHCPSAEMNQMSGPEQRGSEDLLEEPTRIGDNR